MLPEATNAPADASTHTAANATAYAAANATADAATHASDFRLQHRNVPVQCRRQRGAIQ